MVMRHWRECYLDLILIPLSILISLVYHIWLRYKVRTQPLQTVIGINSACRRLWVLAVIKDTDKKNVLAVQSIRNAIMGCTLMASTCILLSMGLAAVISSSYSIRGPIKDSIYGAHGEHLTAFKYVFLLVILLFSFICYSISIRFMNQVNFMINIASDMAELPVGPDYICDIMEKGFVLNTVGNRLFYTGLPLLLWMFGPVLVFISSVAVVMLQYMTDIVFEEGKSSIRRGCWRV